MGRLGLLCSRRFYSNRVCTNLVVAWCFVCLVLHWVVAPLICNLGYGSLAQTGDRAGLIGETFVIGGTVLVAAGVFLDQKKRREQM